MNGSVFAEQENKRGKARMPNQQELVAYTNAGNVMY
jgi:hypothetical protein